MTRVLHVTEAAGSGTLHIVRSLAARLAEAGHEVAIAHGQRPETPADVSSGLPPTVLVHALPWSRRTARAQLVAARALRAFARDWEPDIVHLHSSFAGAVGSLSLPRGAAVVYTPHGSASARRRDGALRRAGYRAVERAVVRRVTLVGAVSEAEAQLARELARAAPVTIVRNGIGELDRTARSGRQKQAAQLVLAGGRIGPARRPAESARILTALRDRAEVAWVGAAPNGEEAPLRAAGVPVSGWLPREEVLARLGDASVYLHWSAWDGLPLMVLEAMARDAVVVASDIPANREALGDRQTCRTEAEAADLIRRLLDDPGLRGEMLAEQHARRTDFGADRMLADWTDVYARLLAATGR